MFRSAFLNPILSSRVAGSTPFSIVRSVGRQEIMANLPNNAKDRTPFEASTAFHRYDALFQQQATSNQHPVSSFFPIRNAQTPRRLETYWIVSP